jgi:hypothetical protein
MNTHHRAVSERIQARSRNKYCQPEPLPEYTRYSRCVCGQKLCIQRIPYPEKSIYILWCYCGHSFQLPDDFVWVEEG